MYKSAFATLSTDRCSRWIATVALTILAACSGPTSPPVPKGGPLPDAELKPYLACSTNEDCTYVQNGCCDCVNGGAETAINRTKVDEFKARFECKDVNCTMVDRIPACGSGKATCVAGLCQYTP